MKVAEKTLSKIKARAQQLKLFADLSTPDCSAPFFNIIGGRRTSSATCILCRLVLKGKNNGAERRRLRLRHLDLKHPEIMEKIEEKKLKELAKKNVQENSTILEKKTLGQNSKAKNHHVDSSFKRRRVQEGDDFLTTFRYICDINKSECKICGHLLKGKSAHKQRKHFYNDHKSKFASTLFNQESSSSGDFEGVIKQEQEGTKASTFNPPQLPVSYPLHKGSTAYGNCKINYKLEPQTDEEVLDKTIKMENQSKSPEKVATHPINKEEGRLSLRPLLPNDDPNSTFTFIKRQDRSQCQICGKFVKGEESINRKMHFNWEHKEQRDHLQLLNGIINEEKVQCESRIQEINEILSRDGENEWKELGILQNNLKSEDSSSEVDSDEEEDSEDIFSIKRAKRSKNKGFGLT